MAAEKSQARCSEDLFPHVSLIFFFFFGIAHLVQYTQTLADPKYKVSVERFRKHKGSGNWLYFFSQEEKMKMTKIKKSL